MNPAHVEEPSADAAGRVLVVGSLNADLSIYTERIPGAGETVHGQAFSVSPGGKSANQAVAAGRLGADTVLLGAVGDDAHATMLLESCAAAGVDVRPVRRVEGVRTGVAVVTVEASGENTIVISAGANGALAPGDIEAASQLFTADSVVCLCLEVAPETVRAAARAGHDAGGTVVLNLSPYAPLRQELAELVDVLLVNTHEASQLLGGARMPSAGDPETAWAPVLESFEHRGVDRAVITLGGQGSVVLDRTQEPAERITRILPTRVDAVDTTGAGDAFTGAIATRLAAGDRLAVAAAYASVAAALATTRRGAQAAYPQAAEVAAAQRSPS